MEKDHMFIPDEKGKEVKVLDYRSLGSAVGC